MTTAIAPKAAGNGQITGVRKASEILAEHLGLDPLQMIGVIKAQCFKGSNPSQITNEQLAAFVNVANSLRQQAPHFNPLLNGMLYAYPSKGGGIEPMIGPDGIYALLGSRPDCEGWETEPILDEQGNLVAAKATIWVKGRKPFTKTVLLREWKMASNPNWSTRPAHMLETRALKQCARQVIHGLPLDREEAEIVEAQWTRSEPADESRTERLTRMIAPAPEEPEQPAEEPEPKGRKSRKPEPADLIPEDREPGSDDDLVM